MRLSSLAGAAIVAAVPMWAHVVSLSTGELRVDGPLAVYELRMPMYEISQLANPEKQLFEHIRFDDAHHVSTKCHEEEGTFICVANYEFPGLIDRLNVECTFYQITVPNHVHVLNAVQGPNQDQEVFDQSFPRAEVRFHPPSRTELLLRDLGAGLWRAFLSPVSLFVLSLVIAARSGREAALLVAMYLIGEWLIRPLAPRIPFQFSQRFIEAAMALTVAYLAVEILLLPQAGKRWAVVLVLGLFHGLYFAAFPPAYLTAAAIGQAVLVTILVLIAARWASPLTRRAAAWGLLILSLGWFATRLLRPAA